MTRRDTKPDQAAEPSDQQAKRGLFRGHAKAWLISLTVLIVLLIAARLALEPVVLWYVNRTLDRDPLYDGEVEDISISLYRGAYSVHGITLQKRIVGAPLKPLLTLDQLDLSLQWSAIFKGSLVGDVTMLRPVVNFVDAGNAAESQTGGGGPWLEMLRDLLPFQINQVTVTDGEVHFFTKQGDVPVEAYLSEIQASVTDLTNVQNRITPLITKVQVTGLAMDQAKVELKASFDPFSYHPTFELALQMLNLDVTQINEIAQVYGGVDFKAGWFDLTVEAKANNGKIDGVVKPLFRDLDVFEFEQDVENGSVANAAWELLVGLTSELLENQSRDQFGTRIEFSADAAGLNLSILEIVGNVLHNAFVQAYLPKLRSNVANGFSFKPAQLQSPD